MRQEKAFIGATVQVVGDAKNITATDMDGNFTLNNLKPGAKLTSLYVGMKTIVIPARPTMKITMVNENSTLDEVVITAFGDRNVQLLRVPAAMLTRRKLRISNSIM